MFCANCGKKLEDGWKICPSCGQKIESEEYNETQEQNETQIKEEFEQESVPVSPDVPRIVIRKKVGIQPES